MQTCRMCGETKSIEEFDLRTDTARRRTECKSCRRLRQRLDIDRSRWRTAYVVGAPEALKCSRCGESKPWTDFPRRGRDSLLLHTWCKPCFSIYKAERHQRLHEREMARIRRNHDITVAANRARVNAYLATHPCVDCGESDVVVLDFDHVRGEKVADVSTMVGVGMSWKKIEDEIAKCEVRCSNDHRRVTQQRRNAIRGIAEDPPLWVYGDPGAI